MIIKVGHIYKVEGFTDADKTPFEFVFKVENIEEDTFEAHDLFNSNPGETLNETWYMDFEEWNAVDNTKITHLTKKKYPEWHL